jgi:hypothetical protein
MLSGATLLLHRKRCYKIVYLLLALLVNCLVGHFIAAKCGVPHIFIPSSDHTDYLFCS